MISNSENRALGEAGFIPGPSELEKDFIKRIHLLKKQTPTLLEERGYELLICNFHDLGAKPNWIPLIYSNRRLLPWQGAASWVITTPEGMVFPLVQLRKGFRKGRFLFNDRDEVLRHEALHAMRVTFNEPRFEEILAYFHAKKKWKQFLGPLFRKPSQVCIFLSLVFLALGVQATALIFCSSFCLLCSNIATSLPLVDLFFRLISLMKDRKVLAKSFDALRTLFPKEKTPFAIAIRLKDSEIQMFATKPLRELLLYIKQHSSSSLRWRQILAQFS